MLIENNIYLKKISEIVEVLTNIDAKVEILIKDVRDVHEKVAKIEERLNKEQNN